MLARMQTMPFPRGWLRVVAELLGVGIPFLFYFLARGAVANRAGEAYERGNRIVNLEQNLGIFWEQRLQAQFLDQQWVIDALNFVYFWGHFPLIVGMAFPLYLWRRDIYSFLRNTLMASGALGLVIYVLFPVAPPRLMPQLGFVDTMDLFSKVSYQSESAGTFTNPFAAVPSLHFGWALVIGITFVWMFKHPLLRGFGLIWPLTQGAAIIITGNHFFFDAMAGGIVSMVAFGIALWLRRLDLGRSRTGEGTLLAAT